MSKASLSRIKRVSTLEWHVYVEQQKYIKDKFGQDAADSANYGWGVDELKDGVQVSTKVYGHGILSSEVHIGDSEITHSFEKWDDYTRKMQELIGSV